MILLKVLLQALDHDAHHHIMACRDAGNGLNGVPCHPSKIRGLPKLIHYVRHAACSQRLLPPHKYGLIEGKEEDKQKHPALLVGLLDELDSDLP